MKMYHTISSLLLLAQFSVLNLQSNAQCSNAPSLVFSNPVLISGTDAQLGAAYRFPHVAPGMDAHIQILALGNGAPLGESDNTTQGYVEASQPYVTAGPNDTSYLSWHISI